MSELAEATLRSVGEDKKLARVGLNGYRAYETDPTKDESADKRLIWSFTILDGDWATLQSCWSRNTPITLRTDRGKQATVRLIAFPVERQAFGLIEFIKQ